MLQMWKDYTHKINCKFLKKYSKEKDEFHKKKNDETKLLCDTNIYIVYDDNFINLTCQDSNWNIDYGD